jgi:hypothetical protein
MLVKRIKDKPSVLRCSNCMLNSCGACKLQDAGELSRRQLQKHAAPKCSTTAAAGQLGATWQHIHATYLLQLQLLYFID